MPKIPVRQTCDHVIFGKAWENSTEEGYLANIVIFKPEKIKKRTEIGKAPRKLEGKQRAKEDLSTINA